MERGDRQATYQGFSNALVQAVEFAVTPFVFALLGIWLDGLLGIRPVLTVTLFALAIFGLGARSYYTYRAAMEREEEGMPWTRSRP